MTFRSACIAKSLAGRPKIAWTLPVEEAHALIERRGISLVVRCPGLGEEAIYAAAGPQGLMATLMAGKVPSWLVPVPGLEGGMQAYTVARAVASAH